MFSKDIADATNLVKGVDTAFVVILGIILFFLVGITITMIYFVFRYRKSRNPKATQIHGSTILEVIWTIIPTLIVLVMFYFGWTGWKPMQTVPKDAFTIKSIGRMWSWQFLYTNGKITDTLYIPVDRPIKLDLVAMDVIHSLYIPSFRVKQDMVPGKESFMWFTPERVGSFDLFCAEYCGLRHSYMQTAVVVLPQQEFDSWYVDTTQMAMAAKEKPGAAGYNIVRSNGCLACHSLDGTKLVGPTWKGLFGRREVVIAKGKEREVIVDSAYIINSIYNPNDEIVKGYSKGLMISYKDELTEEEMRYILEYLKTLNE